MKKLSFFLFFVFLTNIGFCFQKTNVHVFTSERCPHCRDEKVFLEKIKSKYPDVKIIYYDIMSNREKQNLYHEVLNELNVLRGGLPTTIIGSKYIVGFLDEYTTGLEIEKAILDAQKSRSEDVVEKIIKKKKATKI